MRANIKWTTVCNVFIVASTSGDVDDTTWGSMLDDLRQSGADHYLGVANGSISVNPAQRRSIVNIIRALGMDAVVVTDSSLTRGLVTAVSWFVPSVRSFAPDSMDKALNHIGLGEKEKRDVLVAVNELNRRCAKVA